MLIGFEEPRLFDSTSWIGLIADTHGLVRPGVFTALSGVTRILHAGDVGGRAVLNELETIAPVRAVYGNTDAPGDPSLEAAIHVTAGGRTIHVTHGHELGSPTPETLLGRYDADILVYGHTHIPGDQVLHGVFAAVPHEPHARRALVHRAGDRVVVNPGAAGPRRFDVKPSVALLEISGGRVDIRIVGL